MEKLEIFLKITFTTEGITFLDECRLMGFVERIKRIIAFLLWGCIHLRAHLKTYSLSWVSYVQLCLRCEPGLLLRQLVSSCWMMKVWEWDQLVNEIQNSPWTRKTCFSLAWTVYVCYEGWIHLKNPTHKLGHCSFVGYVEYDCHYSLKSNLFFLNWHKGLKWHTTHHVHMLLSEKKD